MHRGAVLAAAARIAVHVVGAGPVRHVKGDRPATLGGERLVQAELGADQRVDAALEVHAREEIGLAPGDLPNPWVAAASSFGSFVVGAIIPVIPYIFGATTLLWSLILSCLGLFAAGAIVSQVTARSWWFSGLRQLLVGAAAAAVTYGVGTLVGTAVG